MADKVELEKAQVKKAVLALQAFLKTKSTSEALFLNETQHISLLFTLWKVPKLPQSIRIPLPHGQRTDTEEICLFTRDEPQMTPEQTQRFYKKLMEEKGVKNISEIIPFKVLKTEYKPFEAKRRLLGNFDLFLSDDRIRRLLPSHIGKHFYERKREPLSVNLQSKNLARDIQRVIQGTTLKVTNKGCCCMARVAHSGMNADEVTENIEATVQTLVAKLRMKGRMIKLIHVKSQTSVALPIYNSSLSHLRRANTPKGTKTTPKKKKGKEGKPENENLEKGNEEEKKEAKEDGKEDEEIPQLVPIETPSKKPKLEKAPKNKQLRKAPKPAAKKKGKKAPGKVTNKAAKAESKVKRKGAKVK